LQAIELAQELGFAPVKVNAVVIRGMNDQELESLAQFAHDRNLSFRFIEFMPLDSARAWLKEMFVPGRECWSACNVGSTSSPLASENPSSPPKDGLSRMVVGEIGPHSAVSEPFVGTAIASDSRRMVKSVPAYSA